MPLLFDSTRFWRDFPAPLPKPTLNTFHSTKFAALIQTEKPCRPFLKILNLFKETFFHFETEILADRKTQFLIDQDEPMQTDPISLSSDEDTEIQYHMSDRDLINDHAECWLNQVLTHPNDPRDTVQTTISSDDVEMPTLSHSATTDPQHDKNIQTSTLCLRYLTIFFPTRAPSNRNKQLATKDSPDSPTTSDKGPNQLIKPYDLPKIPMLYNDPEQCQIN